MQETHVLSLGQEDPQEKGMATHSSILAWRILWTEEPDGLQSMRLQRVRHNWATNTFTFFKIVELYVIFQQYVNRELPDVPAGFRKGRGTRDQIANIPWIIEKQQSSRKTSISALLTMPKPLTVWITTNGGKLLKRWEYQTTLPASWEICVQVKKVKSS